MLERSQKSPKDNLTVELLRCLEEILGRMAMLGLGKRRETIEEPIAEDKDSASELMGLTDVLGGYCLNTGNVILFRTGLS